ncbi:MAG TPA: hypothetical protein VKW04_18615 [Planctomycetota bacterium]|nr:hypothetical protein [Planctomycetota bacterium]
MIEIERPLVLERLQELEGWAVYISEALILNQKQERATIPMIERSVDPRALKEVRELAWMLYSKLHVINTQLELSRGELAEPLQLQR